MKCGRIVQVNTRQLTSQIFDMTSYCEDGGLDLRLPFTAAYGAASASSPFI